MRLRDTFGAHRTPGAERSSRRRPRRAVSTAVTVALVAAGLVALTAGQSQAVQATGDDAAVWQTGWSWTYAQTFNYNDGNGTNVNLSENVTYTVAGTTTFDNQSAYQLTLSGTITGCSGNANAGGTSVSLGSCSGSVSGTEYQRRSDLAILEEDQTQNLNGKADSLVSVSATITLNLTPTPSWHSLDFPLNAGDTWNENENIAYTGGFTYNAGSFGSGSSPFNGNFTLAAAPSVSHQSISVGAGTFATDEVAATSSDGQSVDNQWWAPSVKNDAQEHLQLPLSGATLILDRKLSSATTNAPATSLSETITPSLTCAGATVTVGGTLSSGAGGVGVNLTLDESQASPGQVVNATATTGANGAYSATFAAPSTSDGLGKNGSRANWGITVDAPSAGAHQVASLVVTPQDCTSLAYTGATSAPQGSSATVSAQLTDAAGASGAVGQTITFALSGGASVTATTGTNGVATASLPVAGPPRGATVTATLAATGSLVGAAASTGFTVTTDPTTTYVTSSESSATVGDALTFTAHVTPTIGSNPGGTVQFLVDGLNFGAPVAVSGGTATSAQISTLSLGNHTVQAVYNGDANFSPSTSPTITVLVHVPLLPTTISLGASPSTAVVGQSVALTATVAPKNGSGDPTGSVTFTDGGTTLGSATVTNSGGVDSATLSTSALALGNHSIVATYSGDDTFNGTASTPTAVTVGQAGTTTALGSSAASGATVSGQAINYTATVSATAPGSGTPTGTAQLVIDGSSAGAAVTLSGGVADFPPVTSLAAGPHSVAVSYSGDANYTASTTSAEQDVTPASTTTSVEAAPSTAVEEQAVTITATVVANAPGSGTPTGTVNFTSDGSPIGAAILTAGASGSTANITLTSLPAGTHAIVASYAGDSAYTASDSAPFTETIRSGNDLAATTTVLSSSVNPSTFGQLVQFTATVSSADATNGTPTGAVQFSVDGTNLGGPVPVDGNGVAQSPVVASPPPGDHTVIAAFSSAGAFAISGDTITQTVADAGVSMSLNSSAATSTYGQAVTFTATVASTQLGTGVPTGVVQFRVDDQPVGNAVSVDSTGAATSAPIAGLTPGAHTITAVYSGDQDFLNNSASITQTVGKVSTSTALASSLNPATYGQLVTFTATVTPSTNALSMPSGTVTFSDGSTTLGTTTLAISGGAAKASFATSALTGGNHSITATYNGTAVFAASTSAALTESIAKASTSLTATPALVKVLPLTVNVALLQHLNTALPLGMLQAQLTSGGQGVAGKQVIFTVGVTVVCKSTTNSQGIAQCNASSQLVQLILAGNYFATFNGDGNYTASYASGPLID